MIRLYSLPCLHCSSTCMLRHIHFVTHIDHWPFILLKFNLLVIFTVIYRERQAFFFYIPISFHHFNRTKREKNVTFFSSFLSMSLLSFITMVWFGYSLKKFFFWPFIHINFQTPHEFVIYSIWKIACSKNLVYAPTSQRCKKSHFTRCNEQRMTVAK